MGALLCCCKKRKPLHSPPSQSPYADPDNDAPPSSSDEKRISSKSHDSLVIINKRVNVFRIKRQMKAMRDTLREIRIVQCISDHDRFESVDILLLREDLQVSDFPLLESVTIDFLRQESKDQDSFATGDKQESLDDKLYARALQTIAKDMRTHDLLRDTVDEESITINEAAFRDKRAFLYVMRRMKQLNESLRKVSFKDIVTLKKNIFFTICSQMREISHLQEICVINTNIMTLQAQHLQHLLTWMQNQIKVVVISGANLIDEHIDILFFQKLHVADLISLEKLELKNCPQLWKSDKFIQLMKHYAHIKLAQTSRRNQQDMLESAASQTHLGQSLVGMRSAAPLRPLAISQGRSSVIKKQQIESSNLKKIRNSHLFRKQKSPPTGQLSLGSEFNFEEEINFGTGAGGGADEASKENVIAPTRSIVAIQQRDIARYHEDEEKYDNRHARQLLLGNYLWETDRLEKSDGIGHVVHHQQYQQATTAQATNATNAIGEKTIAAAATINSLGQSIRLPAVNGSGGNTAVATIKQQQSQQSLNGSSIKTGNEGGLAGNNASENEFFSEFLKSSLRELTEIDMCQIVDFSGFSTLTMGADQKRLICTFVTSSNTLSTLVIQYDRFIFKELCEQIAAKCKTRHTQTIASGGYRARKESKARMTESMMSIGSETKIMEQSTQLPSMGLAKATRSNLMSLESLRVIASRLESLQSDSLCYTSFLSMFLISLELDLQNQVVEDSIIFPTYYQIIMYLHKMAMLSKDQEPVYGSEDIQSNYTESMSFIGSVGSQSQSGANGNNNSTNNTTAHGQVSEQNSLITADKTLNNQLNNNNVNLISDQASVSIGGAPSNDNSPTSRRNPSSSHKRDSSRRKDQSNTNGNAGHAPAQQGSEIFETIRQFQDAFGLDTTVQDVSLRNFTWQNEMNTNKEKSFSNFIFAFFSLTCNSLTTLDFDSVNLSHTSLLRLQEILKKIVHLHHMAKLKTQQQAMDENAGFFGNSNPPMSGMYNNQFYAGGGGGGNTAQQSILQMKRDAKKSKYFLKRFRINFKEQRLFEMKNILNIFADIAKEVRIVNANAKPDMNTFQAHANSAAAPFIASMTQIDNELDRKEQQQQQSTAAHKKVLTSLHLIEHAQISVVDIVQINNHLENLLDLSLVRCRLTLPALAQILAKLNRFRLLRKLVIIGNDLSVQVSDQDSQSFHAIQNNKNAFHSMRSSQNKTQYFKQFGTSKSVHRNSLLGALPQKQQFLMTSSNANHGNNNMNAGSMQSISESGEDSSVSDTLADQQQQQQLQQSTHNHHHHQQQQQHLQHHLFLNPNNSSFNKNNISSGGESNCENAFIYCLNKIFQIKTLEHLDLSSNNLSAQQGELLLSDLITRSEVTLQYMMQQKVERGGAPSPLKEEGVKPVELTLHLQSSSVSNQLNTQMSPIKTPSGQSETGLYSKFIKNQITSNLRQGGTKKFGKATKLRSLNTRFFSDEIHSDPDQFTLPTNTNQQGRESHNVIEDLDQEDNAVQVPTQQNFVDETARNSVFTPKDGNLPSNLFLLSGNNNNNNNNPSSPDAQHGFQNILNSPQMTQQQPLLSGRSSGMLRIRKSDTEMPDLLEFYLMENKFEDDIIVDLTKPISVLFPKIKVLDLSAVKKDHPKKRQVLGVQNSIAVSKQRSGENNQQLSPRQAPYESREEQQALFGRLDNFITDSVDLDGQSKNKRNHDSDSSGYSSSEASDIVEDINQPSHQNNNNNNNATQANLLKVKREAFAEVWAAAQAQLNFIGKFSNIGKLSIKHVSFAMQTSVGLWQVRGFDQASVQLQEVDLSGCIESEEVAMAIFKGQSSFGNGGDNNSNNNALTSTAAQIPSPFSSWHSVKKLSLRHTNNLRGVTWTKLMTLVLRHLDNLEILDLSDCSLNDERIGGITDAILNLQSPVVLSELILSRNYKIGTSLRRFVFGLTQANNLRLQTLDLTSCDLSDEACETMIQGILLGKKQRLAKTQLRSKMDGKPEKKPAGGGMMEESVWKRDLVGSQETAAQQLIRGSFSLVKLLLLNNPRVSMKTRFLTQYCFVFQLSDEENILFSMQFSSNLQQKKHLAKLMAELKENKGSIYTHLFNTYQDEQTVTASTLSLGRHLFNSRKAAEDVLLSSLRTFSSVDTLKLFVNEKVQSILTQVASAHTGALTSIKPALARPMNTIEVSQVIRNNNERSNARATVISSSYSSAASSAQIVSTLNYQRATSKKYTFIPRPLGGRSTEKGATYAAVTAQQRRKKSISSPRKATMAPIRMKPQQAKHSNYGTLVNLNNNNNAEDSTLVVEQQQQSAEAKAISKLQIQEELRQHLSNLQNPFPRKPLGLTKMPMQTIESEEPLLAESLQLSESHGDQKELQPSQQAPESMSINSPTEAAKPIRKAIKIGGISSPLGTNKKKMTVMMGEIAQRKKQSRPTSVLSMENMITPTGMASSMQKPFSSFASGNNIENEQQQWQGILQSQQRGGMILMSGGGNMQNQQNAINSKYKQILIHLRKLETLVLESDEKLGIVNTIEFFAQVGANLSRIDLSKVTMSPSMFVRAAFRIPELFPQVKHLLFANIQLAKSPNQLSQVAEALLHLLYNNSIVHLSLVSCSITPLLMDLLLQHDENTLPISIVELDLSNNKGISFENKASFALIDKVQKLNLQNCDLVEERFCLNRSLWKQSYLDSLIDLNISYNKGLSVSFFRILGEFLSSHQWIRVLDISHTALFEAKQKAFSYGLNKRDISSVPLRVLRARGMTFSKKEGSFEFLKAISNLKMLQEVDISDMMVFGNSDVSTLQTYLMFPNLARFSQIYKLIFHNCTFFFETSISQSEYAFSEHFHSSIYILTSCKHLTTIDLTGALRLKTHALHFLKQLVIIRKKQLMNYHLKTLILAQNCIPTSALRQTIHHILFVFRNLVHLNIRSLLRYQSGYTSVLIEALDSFSTFQSQHVFVSTDGSNPPAVNASTIPLTLEELYFSDISNDLGNNKETIDSLLQTTIINSSFLNLRYLLVHLEFACSGNIIRMQNTYSESLVELNEKNNMKEISLSLNVSMRFAFKFSEADSIISLKPEVHPIEDKKKPSFPVDAANQGLVGDQLKATMGGGSAAAGGGFMSSRDAIKPALKVTAVPFLFSRMRVEYVDCRLHEEITQDLDGKIIDEIHKENDPMMDLGVLDHDKSIRDKKQKYLLVNEWNEELFAQQTESEEQEIQLWRQFQPFAKKLASSKMGRGTHISLNYRSQNIKLLSERYNIFVDRKYNLNQKLTELLKSIDALYLGNVLYHFLVSICSFDPQNDLIDFLVHYLLFAAASAATSAIAKDIRLPPFSILSEGDAQKISQAFIDLKDLKAEQKKIQTVMSIFQRNSVNKQNKNNVNQSAFAIPGAVNTEMATIEGHHKLNVSTARAALKLQQITNRAKSDRQALNQSEVMIPTEQGISARDEQRKSQNNNHAPPPTNRRGEASFGKGISTAVSSNSNNNNKSEEDGKIICNYFYKSRRGCEEYAEIVKLKKMPPSTLNIDNFSVNGLKAVYMICYQNDYFMKSDIDFESIMFVSTSLSFSIREYFYRNYASQKRFKLRAIFGKIMYYFMDIFVDLDNYFKYDESINVLDKVIQERKNIGLLLKGLVVLFFISCFAVQPTLSLLELGPVDADGLSYISHGFFGMYVALSLLFEGFVVWKSLGLTQHLIPDIILTHQASLAARARDFFFEMLMNVEIMNYKHFLFFTKTFFSILAQLDTYQDISFILIALNKGEYVIAILAIFIIVGSNLVDLNLFAKMLDKSEYSNLFFPNLNHLYEFATQAHLEGLTNLLDAINPHNVLRITDNRVTRFLLPKNIIGLTINKSIFYKIKKVIAQDFPQFILQLIYTLRQLKNGSSTVVRMSIVLNMISMIKSLLVILTIKQSVLNQMDFDELAEQKQQFLQSQFLQYQEKEIAMFEQISSNVREIAHRQSDEQMSQSQVSLKKAARKKSTAARAKQQHHHNPS